MDPEPNLLVVLNDNRMSISENVGGVTKMLGRMTGSKTLNAIREGGKKLLGDKNNPTARFVRRWEEHWKGMFVPSTLFEEMGFHYTGPIDGHDVHALVATMKTLKTLKGPQLLHIITTKGKGYELAEGDQIGYHAVSPFDPAQGLVSKPGAKKPNLHRCLRRLAVRHGGRRRHAARHHAGDARGFRPGALQQGISGPLLRRGDRRAARGDARGRHGLRRREAGGGDLFDVPAARLRPAGA
jgi:1-deoxy-D-xylulose-5-phosphate synthase